MQNEKNESPKRAESGRNIRKLELMPHTWAIAEKRAKVLGKTLNDYIEDLCFVELRDRFLDKETMVPFSMERPADLVQRLRGTAAKEGKSIDAVVATVFREFLTGLPAK